MRRLVTLALSILACGEDPLPFDGGVTLDGSVVDSGDTFDTGLSLDATEPDLGFVDSGVPGDAGPPPDSGVQFFEASCEPCAPSGDCPGTGLCLRNAANESFCADACGDDPDGCVDGFACVDIGNGQRFCVPPNATCRPPDTGFGARCFGSADRCAAGANACEGDSVALGYCTRTCSDDCPVGYRCGPGDDGLSVCLADYLAVADTCARNQDPGDVPCAIDDQCAGVPGSVCLRTEPSLPGVCAIGCESSPCASGICTSSVRGRVCLSDACRCHGMPTAERDLLDEALANAGLTRCGLIFPAHAYANLPRDIMFDPYRLSWYDRAHSEPLRGIDLAQDVVTELDQRVSSGAPAARAARTIEALAVRLDRPAVHRAPDPPDPLEPLAEAVILLVRESNGTPNRPAIVADAADVPMDLQLALAQVIDALRRAVIARRAAVFSPQNITSLHQYGAAFIAPRGDGLGLNVTQASVIALLNNNLRYGELYGSAADLFDAIDLADLGRFANVPTSSVASSTVSFVFSQSTPIGRIAIDDGQSGLYDPRAPGMADDFALLVDLGGNDVYRIGAGGNQSPANLASVLIDLGGDDRYGYLEVPDPLDGARLPSDDGGRYTPASTPDMDNGPFSLSERPRQGGAKMGIAALVDLGGGADRYRSLRLSQGAAAFGVGVLLDDGGDDDYLAEAASQGAAAFGIGLLLDLGGNDVRRSYTMSQGFGYARGAGLLYDTTGNDRYELDVGDPTLGGDPLYFNGQRPGTANTSLGQGYAFGRRADATDRAFMSGGLGVLIDGSGDDRYLASVFAQGGGFWFGTGILADHDGADHYDGIWYAIASAAHYSMGFLFEKAGSDVYGAEIPRVNVTLGGAHDYSVTALIDEAGDDEYRGSRITLGSGNVNGIALVVDNQGDDLYRPNSAYSLGSAGLLESAEIGSPRRKVNSIGVFIDDGGADDYSLQSGTVLAGRMDNAAWASTNNPDPAVAMSELGSGLDGEGETTLHCR